jgi:predicted ArsR family transcriptional regulator
MTSHAEPSPLTAMIAARIRELLTQRGEPIQSDQLADMIPVPADAVRLAMDYLIRTGEIREEEIPEPREPTAKFRSDPNTIHWRPAGGFDLSAFRAKRDSGT